MLERGRHLREDLLHLGDHRVWGKHTISERGLRSVLMMKVPGQAKRGLIKHEIVSSVDIYPTLAELCALPLPQGLDGKSLSPLLLKKQYNWDNVAYGYFNKGISVRNDRYRFTKYFRSENPTTELYDHNVDPFENVNISGTNPALEERMKVIWQKANTGLYD